MNLQKTIRKRVILYVVIRMTILINVFSMQANDYVPVDIRGDWVKEGRSSTSNCPINVYTDRTFIYIQNDSPDRPITIEIKDVIGRIFYKETIPEIQTAYITIPISTLQEGSYEIVLTGQPVGFLIGEFTQY